jgi:hypothetical protein
MTDTERRLRQQMQNAQPSAVGEGLIDLNQVHSESAAGGICGGAASFSRLSRFAPFLRQTLSAPLAEEHVEMIAGRLYFQDRILRHDAAIIFHFHFELIVRQYPITELEDFGERPGVQAVICVLADMSLEHDALALPDQPTAIDEVLHDMAHFSYVRMRRNGIAVRQNKTRESCRILLENYADIG